MNLVDINKIYLFRHSMLLTKCSYIVIKSNKSDVYILAFNGKVECHLC